MATSELARLRGANDPVSPGYSASSKDKGLGNVTLWATPVSFWASAIRRFASFPSGTYRSLQLIKQTAFNCNRYGLASLPETGPGDLQADKSPAVSTRTATQRPSGD